MRKSIKFTVSIPWKEYEEMEAVRKKAGVTRSAFVLETLSAWKAARRRESAIKSYVAGISRNARGPGARRSPGQGGGRNSSGRGLDLRRGEIWWADLGPPSGKRPVVLLSREEAYAVRTAVTVAPLTTTVRNIPVEVPLDEKDGLPKPCVVNLDSIATIPKRLLVSRITSLSADRMRQIREAIRFALDL